MKTNRNVVILLAVAAVAFVAGRFDLFSGAANVANAVQQDEEYDAEMMANMEAMMKAGTPGEPHKVLHQFVGEWEGSVEMRQAPDVPMMRVPVKVKREMIFDGRYLKEDVESDSEWGMFYGLAYTGYNNVDGLYESVWMDTQSTAIIMETSTFDPTTKTMTSRGVHRDPGTGRMMNVRGLFDMSNPDRHTFKGFMTGPDGKEYQNFSGVFERK